MEKRVLTEKTEKFKALVQDLNRFSVLLNTFRFERSVEQEDLSEFMELSEGVLDVACGFVALSIELEVGGL